MTVKKLQHKLQATVILKNSCFQNLQDSMKVYFLVPLFIRSCVKNYMYFQLQKSLLTGLQFKVASHKLKILLIDLLTFEAATSNIESSSIKNIKVLILY